MQSFGAAIEMPEAWPTPPDRMSFSTLTDIESCPLRWGLTKSQYRSEWCRTGYPVKPNMAAILGLITHASLEIVIQQATTRTESNFGERITAVLRSVGGVSAIVETSMQNTVAEYDSNPRAALVIKEIESKHIEIRAQIRVAVQAALYELATLKLHLQDKPTPTRMGAPKKSPLSAGIYSEIALNGKNGWYGKIDLLIVEEDGVRLEDFKTGVPKEKDVEQILIYAWLWGSDQTRNPAARLPGSLMIRYPSQLQTVPTPTLADLQNLETELLERTDEIRSAIIDGEFPSRPSNENCKYCTVRQLCNDYWNPESLARVSETRFGDVEATVIEILNARMWRLKITRGFCPDMPKKVYVRGNLPTKQITAGETIRLLDVYLDTQPTDTELKEHFVHLTTASEIYWLSDSGE